MIRTFIVSLNKDNFTRTLLVISVSSQRNNDSVSFMIKMFNHLEVYDFETCYLSVNLFVQLEM